MTNDGWIEYIPETRRPRAGEAIAIIGLTQSLRVTPEVLAYIGNPTHVILLFDRHGQRVGLRAATGDTKHAFPPRRYGGGNLWNIAFGGFLRWAGIANDQHREFEVQRLDEKTVIFGLGDGPLESGDFEEFTLKGVAASHQSPNVSISRNGNMTLNCATKQLVRDAESLVLLFNEESRLIGLRPARPDERHSRQLRQASTQRTWTLSAEGFLKRFQIDHSEGRSYEPTLVGDLLVINLDQPKPPRTRAVKPSEAMS